MRLLGQLQLVNCDCDVFKTTTVVQNHSFQLNDCEGDAEGK